MRDEVHQRVKHIPQPRFGVGFRQTLGVRPVTTWWNVDTAESSNRSASDLAGTAVALNSPSRSRR